MPFADIDADIAPVALDLSSGPDRVSGTDPVEAGVRNRVFERDRWQCRGEDCGFVSKKWQEIHHRDGNHGNHDAGRNLVTLCGFCHNVFHLGRAALDGAILIHLPRISQGELNRLTRILYFGAASFAPESEACRLLLGALENQAQALEERLGFSDPALLAGALLRATPREYARRGDKLYGVRLLSRSIRTVGQRDVWPQQMAYWSGKDGPFADLPVQGWKSLFERANRQLGREAVNVEG